MYRDYCCQLWGGMEETDLNEGRFQRRSVASAFHGQELDPA